MVEIGQKVKFDPFKGLTHCGAYGASGTVVGTVIAINWTHRWFSVRYNNQFLTSFKFDDIGADVVICERYGR